MSFQYICGQVELGASGAEEDRVREGGVVADVRERGEPQRVGAADLRPQVGEVGLGGGVAPFVLGLGVDHQAVGAVGHGLRSERCLARRVAPVHVLPGAHFQPCGVQFGHELWRELAPVVRRAVGALDEQRGHAGRVGLFGDRGDAALVRGGSGTRSTCPGRRTRSGSPARRRVDQFRRPAGRSRGRTRRSGRRSSCSGGC